MENQTITVNNKEILITSKNGEKYVAIKPICEAIGVDYDNQIDKINKDEILSELTPLRGATGADGKEYKMRVISLRYVFGWLFTINPNKVKPEIKQQIINYKKQCYDALFDSFTKRTSILKEKTSYQIEIDKLESTWKESEEYKKIVALKQKQSDATKRLNALDKNVVSEQLDMFVEEY